MAGDKTWVAGDVPTAAQFNGFFRDQVITICTSGTRPTTTQEGRWIYETDTDRFYVWNGSAWVQNGALGAWTSWTPVWKQGGSTPSFTNNYSRYFRQGRLITAVTNVTLTAGGTATNPVICTLPVTPVSDADVFTGTWFHSSGGARATGVALIGSSSSVPHVFLIVPPSTLVGSEGAYTGALTSGHKWGFSITYEAAP